MKNKEQKSVIAVVGAGGKTSLILYMAKWLREKNRPVIITTTTHMYEPEGRYYREGQLEEIKKALEEDGIAWVGEPATYIKSEKKITGVSSSFLERLFTLGATVLIEADGAKHFPCKVPADHEPVIPKEAELVIGVAGLDCIGKPLSEICFRPELAAEILETDTAHIMKEEDLVKLLLHSKGTKKGLPKEAEYMVILNKVDLPGTKEAGKKIQELLLEQGCISKLLSCKREINDKREAIK